MAAKGITRQIILEETIKYINETEESMISMHELARRLHIRTPSLYNHIRNTEELQYEVFRYAIELFVENQKEAIEGRHKDDAIRAFADAYYSFASENRGLYRLIMSMPLKNDDAEKRMAVPLLDVAVNILYEYGLDDRTAAHWQRVFRAILHGFITQEELGYFYYYDNIELKESRDIAVECFISGLNAEVNRRRNEE